MEKFTSLPSVVEPSHIDAYDELIFENQIMTIDEVARFLKISTKTAYRLAIRGEIPSTKIGKSYRFLHSSMIHWLQCGGNNGKRR